MGVGELPQPPQGGARLPHKTARGGRRAAQVQLVRRVTARGSPRGSWGRSPRGTEGSVAARGRPLGQETEAASGKRTRDEVTAVSKAAARTPAASARAAPR